MTEETPKLFELERLALYTPVEHNQRAKLGFAIKDGNPRISVFTNTKSDKDGKGVITFAFDIQSFLVFLFQLEKITKDRTDSKQSMTLKYNVKDDKGRSTGEKEIASELWYGKTDGITWLSVKAKDRPNIKFNFKLSEYHDFIGPDGKPLLEGDGSTIYCLSTINLLRNFFISNSLKLRDTTIPRPSYNRNNASSARKPDPKDDYDYE